MSGRPAGRADAICRRRRRGRFKGARNRKMPLINLIVTLIIVGVLLWLVNTYIPMDRKIKSILNVVIVVAVILWLLSAFGILGNLSGIRVGG
jgi:hypothetical protein